MSEIFIGWSEADITPPMDKKVALYGQYYARNAAGIHSRLKTVAAAFDSGEEMFITASLDLVNFQQDYTGRSGRKLHQSNRRSSRKRYF